MLKNNSIHLAWTPNYNQSLYGRVFVPLVFREQSQDHCNLPPDLLIEPFFSANNSELADYSITSRLSPPFQFEPVSTFEVISAMRSIKSSSTGLDDISPKFIKFILPVMIVLITDLINRGINEDALPDCWKKAKVIAVPKQNGEFCPIRILSFMSKVLEKVMATQIMAHIKNNKLLNKHQAAYQRNHSCKTAILRVVDDVHRLLDNNNAAILVLIHFSKALVV